MGTDVTTAVDLGLGSEYRAGISTHLQFVPGPTSIPSPYSSTAYLIAGQTHPVLLECSTVLTSLGHVQAGFGYGTYCHQMGTPGQRCHGIKDGLEWVKLSKLGTPSPYYRFPHHVLLLSGGANGQEKDATVSSLVRAHLVSVSTDLKALHQH